MNFQPRRELDSSPLDQPDARQDTSLMRSTITSVWSLINRFLEWFSDLGLFAWQVMRAAVRRPFEGRELLRQLDEIGSNPCPW